MISLHTVLFDAAGTTPLHYLGTASNVSWLDEIDAEGTFSFTIPHEDADDIAVGSVVKFALGATSTDYVFAGVVESVRMEKTGPATSGVARTTNVSGRGVRAKLDEAVIYPVGASNLRTFTAVSAGQVFKTVFDEAQTRGALTGMSIDFTNTTDSNGDPYTETLTVDEAVGATLLDLASRHQEIAVDVWVDSDLIIHYANHRGQDLTTGLNPLVLRVGQSISEMSTQISGPVRNTILVASGADASTFDTKFDTPSQTTYGRKESFLSLADTTDTTYINLASEKVLLSTAQPADGVTIQLDPSGPIPYIDFEIGDTVLLADPEGARISYRVRSITVSQNPAGELFFVPELGTTRADLDRRLQRALVKLERGNAQGETVISNTPPDLNLGGGTFDIGPEIGTTIPEFVYGEVLSFNAGTGTGTVDVDGITYDFFNGAFVGLEVGDTILAITSDSVTAGGALIGSADYVVTSLVNRAGAAGFPGGSASYLFVAPTTIPGLPYLSPVQFTLYGAGDGMVWAQGTAGALGRVVDYTTPQTFTVPRPGITFTALWGLDKSPNGPWVYTAPSLVANALVVVYNGVSTTYNYGTPVMLGEHGGKIWVYASQKNGATDRRVISISSTGVVSDYTSASLSVLSTAANSVWGCAGGYGLAIYDAGDVLLIPNGTGTISSYSIASFPNIPQSTDYRARVTMSNENLFWLTTSSGDRDYRRWNFASATTIEHLDILPTGFAHSHIATLGGSTVVIGGTDGTDAVYCTTSGTGTTVTTISGSATTMQLGSNATFQVLGKYRTDATAEDYVFGVEL